MDLDEGNSTFDTIADELLFSKDILVNDATNPEKIVFQKEIYFNKLLPYADLLDTEADVLFAKIKGNLGRCVMLRDINNGCIFWTNVLNQYINLYGLRFIKEDHIALISLLYELIIIPNLQSSVVAVFIIPLYRLLRINNLINPEELKLPWRPLYNLYLRILHQDVQYLCFYNHPLSLKVELEGIILASKAYFPENATQEILDELRPKIGQFQSYDMINTMHYFELFLPVQLAPKNHSLGHELWFHEFMKMWKYCNYNCCSWEQNITRLMSKLAFINIGYIDWEPHLPFMFTRFLKSLNLPVQYKKKNVKFDSYCKIGPFYIGLWIASMLGNKSKTQIYLEKFLKTIETFFHPANHGSWLKKLGELFVNISYSVVMRLQWECNTKLTWKTRVPESHKLKDADLDAFVNSMMPIVSIGIFNNYLSQNFYDALHYLALIRPNLVIPVVLEKIYPTLANDIEPHKLITVMTCMMKISRPLVQGSRVPNKDYAFQEGPLHVLPFLFASLSGIDPNDHVKTMVTFRLIATYLTMIPVVDCSKCTEDLTENERLICEETSRFEDFVLQFMDKIFTWIEASSVETVRLENQTNTSRKSQSESNAETSLKVIFSVLLRQLSTPIFLSALHKLRDFIMNSTLETQVAGPLVAVICLIFSYINGQETLKVLLPLLAERFLNAVGDVEDLKKNENLDNQVMYPFLLISRLTASQADALLLYADTLIAILDKVILLQMFDGHVITCFMLSTLCQSLTSVNVTKVEKDLDNLDYSYIKEWGQPLNLETTKLKYNAIGEKEQELLEKLFTKYFIPAVQSIDNFVKSESSITREELFVILKVIYCFISGSDAALPFWDEPILVQKCYENCTLSFEPTCGYIKELKMPDGSNVRYSLFQTINALQEHILKSSDDDTKSLTMISLIWQRLLVGRAGLTAKSRMIPNYYIPKKLVENKMIGCDGWFPYVVFSRIVAQDYIRKLSSTLVFTKTHENILINLLKLSTLKYTKIRIVAQQALLKSLEYFPYAYEYLRPNFIEILQRDKIIHHDAYKGALYLLISEKISEPSLLLKQNWNHIRTLWPLLISSEPSEKPSAIYLEKTLNTMIGNFYTTNIKLEVPDICISVAEKLWGMGAKPSIPLPTLKEIEKGAEELREFGENNLKLYNDILSVISEVLTKKNLHWRYRITAMKCIFALKHPEYSYSATIVHLLLQALIHENIRVRQIAVTILPYIFKQQKKKYIKTKIEVPINNKITMLQPGCREDNAWLRYNYDTRPNNPAQWNETRYVHKCYIGYYSWPHELQVYSPASEQPRFDVNSMTEEEREIYTFFTCQQNVDKFMEYMSLEVKKGEKINVNHIYFFQGLFRNFEDSFLPSLLPFLHKFVAGKQENLNRCAGEIVCGLIRGAKHWPYDMTVSMWDSLIPIMRTVLNNLTKETISLWAASIGTACYDRDPNKMHWLLECLLENSMVDQNVASIVEYGKLILIEAALTYRSWRVDQLSRRLLQRFENRLGENPLQLVRDRLASMLAFIFSEDLNFGKPLDKGCEFSEAQNFLDKLYPNLKSLVNEEPSTEAMNSRTIFNAQDSDSNELPGSNSAKIEREENIRLFNVVCKWIKVTVLEWNLQSISNFYKIYPILCQLENKEKSKEISIACTESLAVMAQSLTLPENIPTVLEAINNVSKSSSWSARDNCLEFLQVFVFYNMSVLLSDEKWITTIQNIVLRLLEDERLEVREKAAEVLSGLFHCTVIPNQESLLEKFKEKAKTKLSKKRKRLPSTEEELPTNIKTINDIHSRHIGVLGMCAFIRAHPYDIPKYILPIFESLTVHLNDPEPIPSTIRKTLNEFKRTHCDGWTGLQGLAEKFTEEQFAVLQDLSIPPSYYA